MCLGEQVAAGDFSGEASLGVVAEPDDDYVFACDPEE